jgi:gliding motility-associated-like protein
MFSLDIYDAGDITPVTQIDTTICAGDSFEVGSSSYTETGSYADTIILFLGCDSIINTNLTVLDPIAVNIEQIQPAIGEGNANGQAVATPTGGNGGYTIEWCDGTTGPSNSNLVGGAECCVTVTDDFGCVGDTCFTMEFLTGIVPMAQADSVDCNGGNTGSIEFSAMGGIPPYDYSWEKTDLSLSGTGILNEDNETASLPNLTAGTYAITIADNFFDTTFTMIVEEPSALELTILSQSSTSCFGFCDGAISIEASGGTPPYTFSWANGADTTALTGLCAGAYPLLLTDANGCELPVSYEIEQPEEFIATIAVEQEVSCFGGSDGQLSVTTNGQPTGFDWSTGSTTDTLDNRPSGLYSVTVTNTDGCQDTTEALLPQPDAPLEATITLSEPVTCFGFSDGALEAIPIGPGESFTYAWSNGNTQANNRGLAAGPYSLTLTNERGCLDSATFELPQPAALDFVASATDITCVSGDNGGQLRIDTVTGGTSPFEYSLDGVVFGNSPVFSSLFAGSYSLIVRDSFGCETEQIRTVAPAPVLTASAGQDRTINLGDTILLSAMTSADAPVFTWIASDSSQLRFTGQSVNVSPQRTTTYVLQVFDSLSLCSEQDIINVKVERVRRVYIPTAFSPNGDGRNDEFFIHGDKALVNIPVMRIFSRTGSLVFERQDIMPNNNMMGWDGRFRGEELNPGIFVYYAEITFADGATEVFTGDVMLMR